MSWTESFRRDIDEAGNCKACGVPMVGSGDKGKEGLCSDCYKHQNEGSGDNFGALREADFIHIPSGTYFTQKTKYDSGETVVGPGGKSYTVKSKFGNIHILEKDEDWKTKDWSTPGKPKKVPMAKAKKKDHWSMPPKKRIKAEAENVVEGSRPEFYVVRKADGKAVSEPHRDAGAADKDLASRHGMSTKTHQVVDGKYLDPKAFSLKEALTLSKDDKKVIDAFTNGRSGSSNKLTTNGKRLDGNWMGGNEIAVRASGGRITFQDVGGRAGQTVQRAVRKSAAPNDVSESSWTEAFKRDIKKF